MATRQTSIKRICKLQGRYRLVSKECFPDKGMLPTKKEVLQQILHEDNWRTKQAADLVAKELKEHWLWCNFYTVSITMVSKKIVELTKKFKFVNSYSTKKRGKTFETHLDDFLSDIDTLFNIFCHDREQRRIQEEEHKLRMNDSDLAFYYDQNNSRIHKYLSVVENPSSSDINFQKRVSQKQIRCDTEVQSSVIEQLDFESSVSDPGPSSSSSSSDFSPQHKRMKLIEERQQNRQSLKNLAVMCERYQISDRAAAAIGSATLKDFGVVTDYDASLVIDRSKLRRERQKYRDEIRKAEGLFEIVDGIYIDGRKDATLVVTESDGKMYMQTDLEEHYVIVGEPGEFYLSHVTPETGTDLCIAQSIYKAVKDTKLESNWSIIGSDGTATMTGPTRGCIASLEALLQRPLQWVICLLHCNELPLRHVFKALDGTTKSPDSFAGVIGSHLNVTVLDWKVANFKPICNQNFPLVPSSVIDELSADQYYGYRICMAVMMGPFAINKDLELLEVGGLSHARWLTLACRILRYYISVEHPSISLATLAEFCIKVYFPNWFEIKNKHRITDGAKNFYNMVQRVLLFPNKKVTQIALKVLKRNAFFAHQENILLSMLADDDKMVRHLAVSKILSMHVKSNFSIDTEFEASKDQADVAVEDKSAGEENKSGEVSGSVRKFKMPTINENAKVYYKLVNLNLEESYEPPAIRNLSNMEIERIAMQKLVLSQPCHNQAVERHIKIVTEVSASVSGFERRDGSIRQKIKSRNIMKQFNTKRQF